MDFVVHLNLIEPWRTPVLLPPSRPSAYYVLLVGSLFLVGLALFQTRRRHLVSYWPVGQALLLGLPALLAAQVLVLQVWPGPLAWMTGGLGVTVPLLALIPVTLAAARGRPLEVAVVGLAASAGVALQHSHNPLTILEGAYYGVVAGMLLTQSFRGRPYSWLRQPVVAAPMAALLTWPALFLSAHAFTFGPLLTGLFTAADRLLFDGALFLLQALVGGLVIQGLYLAGLRKPVPVPSRPAPHSTSLRAQLLAAYLPAAGVALVAVLSLLVGSARSSASHWAFDEAARDASSASLRLARALEQGQEFLRLSLTDEVLDRPEARERGLNLSLQLNRDFSALFLVRGSEVLAGASTDGEPLLLTALEGEALAALPPDAGAVTSMHRDERGPLLTLVTAEGPNGRLLGRMRPTASQSWQDIIGDLQWTVGAGNGFVVDEQRRILAHPNPARVLTLWDARPSYARVYATATGAAYDAPDSAGVRHLVYLLPVPGYPWQVVIEIPSEVVLGLGLDLAIPSLLLTIALAAIGTLLVLGAAWRYSRPLARLAAAAGEIAAGDLNVTVDVDGHDEIGHLGRSFEEMRLSLQRRLSDLEMLLNVTQSVSASYAWSFRPILQAALVGADAVAACVCLNDSGLAVPIAREGALDPWADVLPGMEPVAREAQQQRRPMPVRSVARYYRGLSGQTLPPEARSAVCVPLTAGDRPLGVMWTVHSGSGHLDEQGFRLLDTLAAQAAVVYENSRLLTDAQSERGRLRAILASTADPILVADQHGRLILTNPAADQVLHRAGGSRQRAAAGSAEDPSLRLLLDMPLSQACVTRELHLDEGIILSAAVSPVSLDDGATRGRVVVLRDVTELKQREQAQIGLAANLSRDVRRPLKDLQGYTHMIPRIGDLTTQQQDLLFRIEDSVRQVVVMLDNLIDLNAIEQGEGAKLQPCSVASAVEAALGPLRAQFDRAGHNVRLSLPSAPAMVYADQNLLARAIRCLADNAIKYTPRSGTIGVQVLSEDGGVTVTVTDTGIGISPADQMRIFDRFYRVDRAEVKAVPGDGLGLPIVKAIAEWHGGRVWVESASGRGSRFCVWLPEYKR